ncbi:F-box protein [Cardamine amara subsp. amara]|uniref:F-box protein n=1 Tax=Cardamine amara subsp. amara TaxID=228776 RepID=A0ABD1BBL5_CARAN
MALGKKRIVALGFEFSRGLGRTSSKKLRSSKNLVADCQRQELEDLPQDILVKIISGVEHEDLKQLFHVSKTIREAALIAKQSHFAYNTPRKTSVFQYGGFGLVKPFHLEDCDDEIEAPGAPFQKRYRSSRINRSNKDDSGVSVALFN